MVLFRVIADNLMDGSFSSGLGQPLVFWPLYFLWVDPSTLRPPFYVFVQQAVSIAVFRRHSGRAYFADVRACPTSDGDHGTCVTARALPNERDDEDGCSNRLGWFASDKGGMTSPNRPDGKPPPGGARKCPQPPAAATSERPVGYSIGSRWNRGRKTPIHLTDIPTADLILHLSEITE